ncbi:hypothetical protein BC777_0001, partial [Yoonia maricola]
QLARRAMVGGGFEQNADYCPRPCTTDWTNQMRFKATTQIAALCVALSSAPVAAEIRGLYTLDN